MCLDDAGLWGTGDSGYDRLYVQCWSLALWLEMFSFTGLQAWVYESDAGYGDFGQGLGF